MVAPDLEARHVAESLQSSTVRLVDLTQSELFQAEAVFAALQEREAAVRRFRELAANAPESFSAADLFVVHEALEGGRVAYNRLLKVRNDGYAVLSELRKTEFLVKSMAGPQSAGSVVFDA